MSASRIDLSCGISSWNSVFSKSPRSINDTARWTVSTTTLFRLEHMLKDVSFCLEESTAAGAPFPAAAVARELYAAGMGRGLADQDFAAVLEVVEGMAGTRI